MVVRQARPARPALQHPRPVQLGNVLPDGLRRHPELLSQRFDGNVPLPHHGIENGLMPIFLLHAILPFMQTGGSAGQRRTTRVHAASSMTKSGWFRAAPPPPIPCTRQQPWPCPPPALPTCRAPSPPTIIAVPGSTPWRSMSRASIPALRAAALAASRCTRTRPETAEDPRMSSRRRVTSSGLLVATNNRQPPRQPLRTAAVCRGTPGFRQRQAR